MKLIFSLKKSTIITGRVGGWVRNEEIELVLINL